MNEQFLLQAMNAFLCCISLVVLFIFSGILLRNWPMRREPFFSAAIAIVIINAGHAVRQGFFWAWRFFGGEGAGWLELPYVAIPLGSLVVIAIGTSCLLRVFAQRYGSLTWVIIIFLSGMVAIIFSAFDGAAISEAGSRLKGEASDMLVPIISVIIP